MRTGCLVASVSSASTYANGSNGCCASVAGTIVVRSWMMGMSHLLHDGVESVDLVGRVLDDPLGAIGLIETVAA